MLRDLGREDAQIDAVIATISNVTPDVLLLTDFDYDMDGLALAAFAERLDGKYPYRFAARPNSGMRTGLDLDRNGRLGEARDAQGYGRFPGDGGMAILSRWPIRDDAVRDFSDLLWRDLDGASLPLTETGDPWPEDLAAVQRLSTTGHWIVPVETPVGAIQLMAWSATPPVFDGPEDRNGLRNRDELRLWSEALDGAFGPVPEDFVIIGNANLDPTDGQGFSAAMAAFLAHPRLQDPRPGSEGGLVAANSSHVGDPSLDTADWSDDGPGNLRVSYILPASSFTVVGAGVFWPAPDDPDATLLGENGGAAGPHRLVWVDIDVGEARE